VIYLTGHFILRGGDINAETTYAAQDGKEPGENRLLGPHGSIVHLFLARTTLQPWTGV
jgi:hypothetical protein